MPNDSFICSTSTRAISVVVTAPHGVRELAPLLVQLRAQLGADDCVTILDGTSDGPSLPASVLPTVGRFEHKRGVGESAFHLRCHVGSEARRDIVVLFEDHVIPGPNFMAEARRVFADPSVAAIKVMGRNERSREPWSWANFFMTFAGCLHPSPVAPEMMLSTSAAIRGDVLGGRMLALGEWETEIMPGLNREPQRLAWSNDVWIDHVDRCDMKQAVLGNYRNQRALAALRVARGRPRRKTLVRPFKDLVLRCPAKIDQALVGRPEAKLLPPNRWRVHVLCWAAMLGALAGAWFGPGSSMRKMH